MNGRSCSLHNRAGHDVFEWLFCVMKLLHYSLANVVDPLRQQMFGVIAAFQMPLNHFAHFFLHDLILKGLLKEEQRKGKIFKKQQRSGERRRSMLREGQN